MGFHERLMELKSSHRFTMSRRHLAERWCISIETLKRREKAGILIPLKLGRGVRYRLTDIERIEQQAEVRR
jgi:hypothetical protein